MRTAVAAILAALVLAAPAQALDRDWRARAGIEQAKAAGIYLDPAAADAMSSAPIGSCLNDPTRPGCGQPSAIIHADLAPDGRYIVAGETAAGPSAAEARAAYEARTAAEAQTAETADLLCYFRPNYNSPWKAAGYAQGAASHECWEAIERQELYGQLYKRYNAQWHLMDSKMDWSNEPVGTIRVHPRYGCTATPRRSWNFSAQAYVDTGNVWYATGNVSLNNTLYCG